MPVKCDVCGKVFEYKSKMRIHTGEKPYACEICDKRFRGAVNLVAHTRTHTDQKPCICSICGKKFKAASPLMRHENSHRGEAIFL
uniref:C2H2-type domain-containing protein n=1 Tax=Amphiprion percula TaxID=161767 RepID=A0A3P8S3T8_AMPPE